MTTSPVIESTIVITCLMCELFQARIQELEIAVEVKDNEILRALKASKNDSPGTGLPNGAKQNSSSSSINKHPDCLLEEPAQQKFCLDQIESTTSQLFSRKIEKLKPSKDASVTNAKDDRGTVAVDKGKHSCVILDEDEPEVSTVTNDMHEISQPDLEHQILGDIAVKKSYFSKPAAASDTKGEVYRPRDSAGVSGSKSGSTSERMPTSSAAMDEDTVLILDDIKQVQSFVSVEQEIPSPVPIYQPGNLHSSPLWSGS